MRRAFVVGMAVTLAALVLLGASAGEYRIGKAGVRQFWYGQPFTRTLYGSGATPIGSYTVHGIRPVDVRAFGVVGDGVTDDADSLQAVLDARATARGHYVLAPPGIYRVSKTLLITDAHIDSPLVFDFRAATLLADTTINGPVIAIGALDGSKGVSGVTILAGKIKFASRDWDYTSGVRLTRALYCRVEGLSVDGAMRGVELKSSASGCVFNRISVNRIYDCLYGVYVENSSTGWVNDNTITGGSVYYSTSLNAVDCSAGAAIYAKPVSGATHQLDNNRFHDMSLENGSAMSDAYLPKAIFLQAAINHVFHGFRMEGFDGAADTVRFVNVATDCEGIQIVGGTAINKDDLVTPRTVRFLVSQRAARIVGVGSGYSNGGPALELWGRGGYGAGYPMLTVIRTGTDTLAQVNNYGIRARAVRLDTLRQWNTDGITVQGSLIVNRKLIEVTASTALNNGHDVVSIGSIAAPIIIDLPPTSGLTVGKQITVIKRDAQAADTVRVRGYQNTESINGVSGTARYLISQYDYITVIYLVSGGWAIVGGKFDGTAY